MAKLVKGTTTLATANDTAGLGAIVQFVETSAAGANTYLIQSDTEKAQMVLRNTGGGDTVVIEDVTDSFTVRIFGKSVYLVSSTQTIQLNQPKPTAGAAGAVTTTLEFLDGSVNLVASVSGKSTVYKLGGQTLSSKAVAFAPTTVTASDNAATAFDDDAASGGAGGTTGQTYTLTAASNTVVGTANNDNIDGSTTSNSWSAFDNIDGGDGTDTMSVSTTNASTPGNITLKNVENLTINTSGAGYTINTTGYTGLTELQLSATAAGAVSVTADAATTVGVATTGASTVTVVGGGGDLAITAGTSGVTVGASAVANAFTSATITNGSTVAITDRSGASAATGSKLTSVAVKGNATSDDVTITADGLTSLSLTGFAGANTVGDTTITAAAGTRALALNLSGMDAGNDLAATGGSSLTITDATATSLAITNTAASYDVTTSTAAATAVTVAATAALQMDALTAAAATTLGISGTGAVTLAAQTIDASAVITSTNTGGVTLTTALGNSVQFVGTDSSGADTIGIGATTKAITMGAGNDTVNLSAALGTGGSLAMGDGTDTLALVGDMTDAVFSGITSLENVKVTDGTAGGLQLALGANALAAGVNTVTFGTAGAVEEVTLAAAFTNDVTVIANDTLADQVVATAYTKNLTIKTAATGGLGTNGTWTGGTGTADQIVFDLTTAAITQAGESTITAIESMTTTGSTTRNLGITLDDANIAAGKTLTIDGSALTTGVLTVVGTAEADGYLVVKGGGAADLITGTGSSVGDNLTGGAGNDTFTMAGNITSADTIAGGDGTDTITVSATILDAVFTKVTGVEGLTVSGGSTATIDTLAQAAGIVTLTQTDNANQIFNIGSGYALDLTVALNDDGDTDQVVATNYTKNLTVTTTSASGFGTSNVITGGTGTSDKLTYNITSASATQASNATITKVETINTTGSTTNGLSITLHDNNITAGKTLTIDGSALTTGVLTVVGTAEADGYLVVNGGGAADVITGTASSVGDSLTGGAGNDTFKFATANLTSADTVAGGDGTDTVELTTDGSTVVDADFTKFTSVEVVTSTADARMTALTLDTLAAAAGVTTVTLADTTAVDTVNVNSGFTTNLTVNFDSDANGANAVLASGYTKVLTIVADDAELDNGGAAGVATITGGTGTSDELKIAATGGTVQAADLASVTAIEKFTITGTTTSTTISTHDANAASGETLTIDASSLTTGVLTLLDVSAETNGKLVIIGGGAADTITISQSSNGDNISGGAGADVFNVSTTSYLTSADTIDGGAGSDVLEFDQAAGNAVTDAMFTKLTSVETVKLTTDTTGQSVTLGTLAVAAGVVAVNAAAVTTETKSVTIDLSGMVGSAGVSITGGAGSDVILGGVGNDTIDGGTAGADVHNDVITGGAGADMITTGATTAITTVKINLNADVAAGTTLANADQITGFTTGQQFIDLSGVSLMSTGGTILALTNAAVTDSSAGTAATENDTVAKDDLGSTTAARFIGDIAASTLTNMGALANQPGLVFEIDTDVVTTGSNTLLTQDGVTEAVTYIGTNIGTATVANTNVFFIVNDGTNSAIFQYQEGALDQGIQSTELTLVAIVKSVTDINAGDIV